MEICGVCCEGEGVIHHGGDGAEVVPSEHAAHADMLLIAAALEDWPEYVVLAAKCTTEAELHDLAGCWSMNFWYWRNFDFRRMQSLGQTLLLGWRKIG